MREWRRPPFQIPGKGAVVMNEMDPRAGNHTTETIPPASSQETGIIALLGLSAA
jgi:hypothetical protein